MGDMLASCNNHTFIRTESMAFFLGFGASILVGGVYAALYNSIEDDTNNRPRSPSPEPSVRESLMRANRLVNGFYGQFDDRNELCRREQNRHRRDVNSNNFNCPIPVIATAGQNYANIIEETAAELRDRHDTITTDVSNDTYSLPTKITHNPLT